MILVGLTILLVAAMALNHAVHGVGCWGLQPGGSLSATIYDLQIIAALIGLLWLLVSLTRRTLPWSWLQLSAIAVFVLASVATYLLFGWAAHTSVHWQGPENLLAFMTVAGTTYLIGRYDGTRVGNRSQSNDSRSGSPFPTSKRRRRWLQFSLRTLLPGRSLMAARWHRCRYVLIVVLLTCVIAGAMYFGWAAHRALVVSHTAVFGQVATEWVSQYVEEHHGAWPPSWDALLDCSSPPVFPGHDPADFIETLKTVVAIDFQADPRELAGQTVEQFTVIRSLDGYGVDDREFWDVSSLIQTLRKYHAVNMRDPAASSAPDSD